MRQVVRQLMYIMLITKNHGSFHLSRKENLVEYLKVSKYYEHGCRSIAGPSITSLERRSNITGNFVFGYLKEYLGLLLRYTRLTSYFYKVLHSSLKNLCEIVVSRKVL